MLKFQALILQSKSESNFWQSLNRVHNRLLNGLTLTKVRWSMALAGLCMATWSIPGSAQTLSASQKYALGVKAAPHFTLARYRDRDMQKHYSPSPTFGYTVGAQIKFPLKDN